MATQTETKPLVFQGFESRIYDSNDKFVSWKIRVPKSSFDLKNLENNKTTVQFDRAKYESKFQSFLDMGLTSLPDKFFEYTIELTDNDINFYGFTELTARIGFVHFFNEYCPELNLKMVAERTITFKAYKKTNDEEADTPFNLNMFGTDADGDY